MCTTHKSYIYENIFILIKTHNFHSLLDTLCVCDYRAWEKNLCQVYYGPIIRFERCKIFTSCTIIRDNNNDFLATQTQFIKLENIVKRTFAPRLMSRDPIQFKLTRNMSLILNYWTISYNFVNTKVNFQSDCSLSWLPINLLDVEQNITSNRCLLAKLQMEITSIAKW